MPYDQKFFKINFKLIVNIFENKNINNESMK